MEPNLMAKLAGLLATLSLASVGFAAPAPCLNRSDAASQMLSQLHDEADQVRDSADLLEAYNREPSGIDWRIQADTLETMRDQINQMDQIMYRLRNMEGKLPQDEKAAINRIAPAVVELTDTTQTAITFLNNNELLTWLPKYQAYAREMYSEAGRVERYSATPASPQSACAQFPRQMTGPAVGS